MVSSDCDEKNIFFEIVNLLPDAVAVKDASDDFRYRFVNKSFEELYGNEKQEIIGKRDVDFLPADEAEWINEADEDALKAPCVEPSEGWVTTNKGKRRVELRKFGISTRTRTEPSLLICVQRDVTELRAIESQLLQMQRIDALGQLTGGIAHDFNNLLAIAIGNLDILDDTMPLQADSKELLDSARSACLRGAELTSRLLAFARRQTLQPVLSDINSLITDYAKLLERLLGAQVDLRLDLAEDLWQARADRSQLEVAITNLATNARDAMPRGGQLRISTRNETLESQLAGEHSELEPGDYIAIEVSDTGCGMPAEVQAKAVEPFFTTKSEGKGTGLGLSMVFGFAKQSGGTVRIHSEVGTGTSVTLLLPRDSSVRVDEASERPGELMRKGGETILVVDDNDSLRRVAVAQLASLGYQVRSAIDGSNALELLQEKPAIDLMLTDIIMPGGLSGVELGSEARKLNPGLKVVYMSGFPESAFGEERELDQDSILLRKPFRKAELGACIRAALDEG